MANQHGHPTKGAVDEQDLRTRAEAHIAITSISDDLIAIEAQIAELAMVIEGAKADRTHTPLARLLSDMRALQDKARGIRADEAAKASASREMRIERLLMTLPKLPHHAQERALEILKGQRVSVTH